jgi:hypothetical protein
MRECENRIEARGEMRRKNTTTGNSNALTEPTPAPTQYSQPPLDLLPPQLPPLHNHHLTYPPSPLPSLAPALRQDTTHHVRRLHKPTFDLVPPRLPPLKPALGQDTTPHVRNLHNYSLLYGVYRLVKCIHKQQTRKEKKKKTQSKS